MFKAPFSFDGRIRRKEYGFSLLIYFGLLIIVSLLSDSGEDTGILALLLYIPIYWFMLAQGAKRCHDLGNNGWWQIIPFYFFWLLFENSKVGSNEYGDNPKSKNNTNKQIISQTEKTNSIANYCHVCGEKLEEESKFCTQCGKKVNL